MFHFESSQIIALTCILQCLLCLEMSYFVAISREGVRHCSRCSSDFELVHNVPSDFEVVHNVTSVL